MAGEQGYKPPEWEQGEIMNDERCPICQCVTHVGPHGAGVCYPPEDDDHTNGSGA